MTLAMLLLAWLFQIADAAGDSGRPPQCIHFAEAILLDYGPCRWLQPFETAWRRLLHPRTNSGRRDWRNSLRTRPPQARWIVGYRWTFLIFVALPLALSAILLWPVLGTHYGGMPIDAARLITLLGLAISFLLFERVSCARF